MLSRPTFDKLAVIFHIYLADDNISTIICLHLRLSHSIILFGFVSTILNVFAIILSIESF